METYPEQIAKTLLAEAFHSRRLVVAIFVVVNAVLLTAGFLWPKSYSASTTIIVDETNMVPLMVGTAVATGVAEGPRNAREVIFGRKIIEGVLKQGGWSTESLTPREKQWLIEGIKARTTVSLVGRNIVRIEYRDSEPDRAVLVTAAFADLFIKEFVGDKEAEIRSAYDFIDKQTQEYQDKLIAAEAELRQLRAANLDARPASETELSARLMALNTRIENATLELREAEMKKASLERQLSGESDVNVVATRDAQLRGRIADLQARLDTLRLSYHDMHPDVIQLTNQIRDLTAEADAQRTRGGNARPSGRVERSDTGVNNPVDQQLRRELSQTELTIVALKARIEESQRLSREEVTRGRGLHGGDARLLELGRTVQVTRDVVEDLQRRRERARVSLNLDSDRQGANIKILDPATASPPASGPRFWQFVLGGLVLGALIPLGLLFARLQLDPRVRLAAAISDRHKVRVAAVVPHLWTPRNVQSLRREVLLLTLVVVGTIVASAALSVMRLMGTL